MSSLPPQSYHPSKSEFEKPDGDAYEKEVVGIEQLFRAAYSIGGVENGRELINDVVEFIRAREREQLEHISVEAFATKTIDETTKNGLINAVNQHLSGVKSTITEARERELEQIHGSVLNTITDAEEELINHGVGEFITIEIVNQPLVSFEEKTLFVSDKLDESRKENLVRDIVENTSGEVSYNAKNANCIIVKSKRESDTREMDSDAELLELTSSEYRDIRELQEKYRESDSEVVAVNDICPLFGSPRPTDFNYSYPVTVVALKVNHEDDVEIHPFLPWFGVTICLCEEKASPNQNSKTLCKHEVYALYKYSIDEFNPSGVAVSERKKRLVHPVEHEKFTREILRDTTEQ